MAFVDSRNLRVYYLAFIVYWGIVLFGYDVGIAGGVVSQEAFKREFGLYGADGNINSKKVTEVSSNVVSVLQAGAFFGALASAPISSAIGRRMVLVVFSAIFMVGAILTTVAGGGRGLGYIYAGRVISGLGTGGISAVAPAFVSECSPKSVRGRITGLFQIMVAFGVLISYFINYGISIHLAHKGAIVWRLPFGFQIVPNAIMLFGLLTVKESPRWLASKDRNEQAIQTLAYLRKSTPASKEIIEEFAEIQAALAEEREARAGLGLKEAFFGKGNFIRFVIAFVIFLFQQFTGQNSVSYYAPQIFASIGYSGTTPALLASGVYGVVKVVATAIFVFFFVETLGRKRSLQISALGLGTMFFIVGAIFKTHPPPKDLAPGASPPAASQAMAAMLYIYVCFYSMGWGPLPWVYVSDIFPTRTRHYGLATASASQWLFNFVVSYITPTLEAKLGYKLFFMFAAINIGGLFVFACLIPETKGRSLEDMDVLFGAVSAEQRAADIAARERELDGEMGQVRSTQSDSRDEKV